MARTKEAKEAKVIPFPGRKRQAPRFDSVSVLISSAEAGGPDKAGARELAESVSLKAESLESDLANDGKALKEGVVSYLVTMAGGRQDELSGAGVRFKGPSSEVVLKSGEADDPGSKGKIDAIVEGCMAAAKDDLEFLRRTLKSLKDPQPLPGKDAARLKDILEKNTYWRFLEAT